MVFSDKKYYECLIGKRYLYISLPKTSGSAYVKIYDGETQ